MLCGTWNVGNKHMLHEEPRDVNEESGGGEGREALLEDESGRYTVCLFEREK